MHVRDEQKAPVLVTALLVAGVVLALLSAPTGAAAAPAPPVAPAAPSAAPAAPAAPASVRWSPGPAPYGVVSRTDVPVTMRDGRVLRADIHSPADPRTGRPAPGKFPVILVQTPYGKSVSGGRNDYLITRGYIMVIVDVAGTGGSEGQSQLFGRVEARDGAELVRWSARLPRSNGKVGLTGGSYLGIDQLFTAAAVGRRSPLKAIFPIAAAADPYRDLFVSGGVVNMESSLGLIASYFGLRTATPFAERPRDPLDALRLAIEHGLAGIPFELQTGLDAVLQQGRVYDSPYWQERAPQRVLGKIVRNRVPAFLVGGLFDVFQRGEPLLYSGLQNAWAGRRVTAPMAPGQKATPRYQLLFGPWDHNIAGSSQFDRVQLRWFDQWLKGKDTGILDTRRPLRVIEPRRASYRRAAYPSEKGRVLRLDLQPGGVLRKGAPASDGGSSQMLYTALSLACSQSINQWGAGSFADLVESCSEIPDATDQPGEVSFSTGPLPEPLRLAGPAGLTLRLTSTRPDTMIVAELQEVAPDGTTREISGGALLGSLRKVDARRSWRGAGGGWIMPHHPLTKGVRQPVPVGRVFRQDIEIRPVFATIPKGHSLRLLLKSGDTPHLLPPPLLQPDLLLGLYSVQHRLGARSFLDVVVEP